MHPLLSLYTCIEWYVDIHIQQVFSSISNSTYELLRADWLQWTQAWGYRTTLMYMPSDVYNLVKLQMKKAGYIKEWEVVSAALRSLDKEIPSVIVLRGNDSHQLFRETEGYNIKCKK